MGVLQKKGVLALLKKPLVIVQNMIKPSLKHYQKIHPNIILYVMVKILTNKLLLSKETRPPLLVFHRPNNTKVRLFHIIIF